MTQIINLTPHDIHIVDVAGNVTHTFPKSGRTVRLDISTVVVDNGGIPTVERTVDLDRSQFNGIDFAVIVSAQVAGHIQTCRKASAWSLHEAMNWRNVEDQEWEDSFPTQIFTVGDTVKDSNGAIVGAKFLVLN